MIYKIILVDDHEMLREGLSSMITKDPQMVVVGQAGNGVEALGLLKTIECDVMVVDLAMPKMDGMTLIREITVSYPDIEILVLTMQKDHEHFKRAMTHGASGYVLKDEAYDQLNLAIKMIMNGKKFVSPAVSTLETERYIRSLSEGDEPSLNILTQREKQLLKKIALGDANKKIATDLNISIRTVETHRANLTKKLGIKSTAGLVKYAINKGLV
jgi:DNA-binding NarL/FixJ family response regulator